MKSTGVIALLILFSQITVAKHTWPKKHGKAAIKMRGPANQVDSTTKMNEAIAREVNLYEQVIKFVVFLNDSGKPEQLVYQNAEKFEFHSDFLVTLPAFSGKSREQIDQLTYLSSPNRKAYLGSVISRGGDDAIFYTRMQLIMEEAPHAELVIQVHKMLMDSINGDLDSIAGGKIEFEILPHQQSGFSDQAGKLLNTGIQIFQSRNRVDNISYTDAWAVGKVVLVRSEEDLKAKIASGEVHTDSIILTDQNLREIPIVAGVISSVELTPASHLVLLGQMYGSPIVYYKTAMQIFTPLIGKTIYLNSKNEPNKYEKSSDYLVEPSSDVLKRLNQLKSKQQLNVSLNMDERTIRDAKDLSFKDISAYGGKASQVGILMRTIPDNTLEIARAIPISFYKEFVAKTNARTGETLEAFIGKNLQNLGDHPTAPAVSETLKIIRDEIKATRIPTAMLAFIRSELEKAFPGPNVRLKLRSSSNAEDGSEFNGAGLYDSEGVSLTGGKADDLEKGLNKVWRSLYTDRGYNARRRFNADESKVGMGILAQKTYKGELANGVLVFSSGEKSTTFNVYTYKGEDNLITHGTGEIKPEIIDGHIFNDEIKLEVTQGFDNGPQTRTLMSKEDYQKLGELMTQVATQYGAPTKQVHIECEFKQIVEGNGTKVIIKQVRPVPQKKLTLLPDGSKSLYIFPRTLVSRRLYSSPDVLSRLLTPEKISLKIASATEKEAQKGLSVRDVQFEILGETFKFADPKVKGTTILLPTKKFPSLELKIELPNSNRNAVSAFDTRVRLVMSSDSKDWKFAKKYQASGASERPQYYGPFHADEPPSDWFNDNILGDQKLTLAIKGKQPFTVRVTKMKHNGLEGDGRSVRLGEAEIVGLFTRPLKLQATHMNYGANHHSEGEAFAFDLLGDASLTEKEKIAIKEAGRFLLINPISWDEEEARKTFRLREDGKLIHLGGATITDGGT